MNAVEAKVGQRYLSPKGTPVTVVGHKGDKVILKISNSENEIRVSKDYKLKPVKDSAVGKDTKITTSTNAGGKNGKGRKSGKESLSTVIDPFLLAGGKTVREISDLVVKQAGALTKDRDVEANVRARMVGFSRKGWKIERDSLKHVKVTSPNG